MSLMMKSIDADKRRITGKFIFLDSKIKIVKWKSFKDTIRHHVEWNGDVPA